eukprot:CAMPEP_0113692924 /NCGR_PEP_ID=MMETSP0038_2-20120614/19372_1 /TAXON_ID=2898 /ORGANISM="Cryptomonas paramecium" /LENGTH=256 /DNA_ID=CAMNT_0000614925 /DNA_START=240 /DNA_END=1006 /DNA_ORIENTATION=- /assembly_acc=CAM_ASM_000170
MRGPLMVFVTLENVEIQNPRGFSQNSMVRIGRVDMLLNGWTIPTSCVSVNSIFVRDIDIFFELRNGKLNLSAFKNKGDQPGAEPGILMFSDSDSDPELDFHQHNIAEVSVLESTLDQRPNETADVKTADVNEATNGKEQKTLGNMLCRGKRVASNLRKKMTRTMSMDSEELEASASDVFMRCSSSASGPAILGQLYRKSTNVAQKVKSKLRPRQAAISYLMRRRARKQRRGTPKEGGGGGSRFFDEEDHAAAGVSG